MDELRHLAVPFDYNIGWVTDISNVRPYPTACVLNSPGGSFAMTRFNRRQFLGRSRNVGLGAVALTILSDARSVRATPANDKLVLAAVGCGGRGGGLIQGFLQRDDCAYAYACDPDTGRANAQAQVIEQKQGRAPKVVSDFREALADKSVDAIVSATPDHWHALTAVWACQAEKDVYVEKPPTHNCWEGQQMLKAARKYNRIVQCGFQNRSAPYNMAAKKYLEEGKLGTIHLCRIYNQKPPWGMCSESPRQRSAGGLPVGYLEWTGAGTSL